MERIPTKSDQLTDWCVSSANGREGQPSLPFLEVRVRAKAANREISTTSNDGSVNVNVVLNRGRGAKLRHRLD